MAHIVYGLIDPISKNLRYIGFTSNPQRRLANHHIPSKLQELNHKNNWIKSLIKNGQQAEMIVIQEYETSTELPDAEIFWYQYFKMQGAELTNDPDFIGGPTLFGKKLSEEHKNKLSLAHKGKKLTDEHKQKISVSNKGKTKIFSEEHIKNLSISHMGQVSPNKGKKHSEASKQKMSQSLKGRTSPNKGKKLSPEHKKKMSEAAIKRHQNNKDFNDDQ